MAGYADVMNGIVNDAREDVLESICGAYMCNVDIGEKKDEPAVITVEGMQYGTKKLLGKNVQCVTYDVAVYSCDEERARQGKKSWICIGAVPSAFGLLENEISSIRNEADAMKMVTTSLAAGFESAVKMIIQSMDKMSEKDEQRFRADIVSREELMEEMFGDIARWDDDEDEGDDGPGYDADGGCSNFERQARDEEKYYKGDYDDCGMFRPQ